MINVKCIEASNNIGFSLPSIRYHYLCPFCKVSIVFFHHSPQVCRTCHRDLPEVGELFADETFKRLWHRAKDSVGEALL